MLIFFVNVGNLTLGKMIFFLHRMVKHARAHASTHIYTHDTDSQQLLVLPSKAFLLLKMYNNLNYKFIMVVCNIVSPVGFF